MNILNNKCINRLAASLLDKIKKRSNSEKGIVGCKYWQLMYMILYEYVNINPIKPIDFCNPEYNSELLFLSKIYNKILKDKSALYRVVVDNELIPSGLDVEIIHINDISDIPNNSDQTNYCMCIYTDDPFIQSTRKIGQILHYFTIIKENGYWINSSYGSNYVCIPQYTTKLIIEEFNDFCKNIQEKSNISEFMIKYFLSGGIEKPYNENNIEGNSKLKFKMLLPDEGQQKELNYYLNNSATFKVGWIKNYEKEVRKIVRENYSLRNSTRKRPRNNQNNSNPRRNRSRRRKRSRNLN